MSKRTFASALFLSLVLTILFRTYWGKATVYSLTENYTVPSRTPIPSTKKPGGGGGGSTSSTATNTPIPATATHTAVPVTLAPTPVGGFVPTAEACGEHPTIQALNTTRVRMGPGIAYEIVGELVYLEVRPIIGRAVDVNWWQIIMADNTIGWVSDEIVIDQGNVSVLPIVAAPELDGVAATPGVPWDPTIEPGCSIAPVWTSTPEPTAVPQTESTAVPTETPTSPSEAVEEIVETSVEVAKSVATETAVPPTAPPQPTKPPTPIAIAEPLELPAQSTNTGYLPIIAAVLLAAGGIIAFLRRNR
ncbi:MAG: SH3 domain-containing protein [Chloroflexi bacterium]|nr:MAG: SH3 domain-containing protein [Chloroflexota bacterium]